MSHESENGHAMFLYDSGPGPTSQFEGDVPLLFYRRPLLASLVFRNLAVLGVMNRSHRDSCSQSGPPLNGLVARVQLQHFGTQPSKSVRCIW